MNEMIKNTFQVVVLGDNDTWDGSSGSTVHFITDAGDDELYNGDGFKSVSNHNIVKSVSIKELVDCWLKHNP
jgi:hypothetical protein